jgi:inner membrane protein
VDRGFVQLRIPDAKGLNEEVKMNWNGQELSFSPDVIMDYASDGSMNAPLRITGLADLQQVRFHADLNLSGSEQLLFTPTGRSTSAEISSSWPHPSFTGDILPLYSNIQDSGFTARWKSTSIKRNFPQQWKEDAFQINTYQHQDVVHAGNNINQSAFGVNLFVPVNGYQKTMRSIKYAALCILLTFAAFFLIEVTNKRSVHPLQYGLIGLALVLFYTLLLSISEYIGFNPAYIIASVCTIGLIGWFVKGILSSGRLTLILSLILVLMYSYIFTLLQLQDYSLLLGSIGLFITLAIIMHFSKKIQW